MDNICLQLLTNAFSILNKKLSLSGKNLYPFNHYYMTLKLVFLMMVASIGSLQLWAQKAPVKFGKIDEADLKMTVYEPDTSATAVVLCQYGHFSSTDFRFFLTRRVKILKKEGLDQAEYICKGGDDVVVRGKTYNLENGVIVEEKLKTESIFKERITEAYYRYRIAMPNVRVGSVIDIETSQDALPEQFAFQDFLPVRHAELLLEENQYIEYKKRSVGSKYVPYPKGITYEIDTVPAFKVEPFMNSPENYLAKFEFDILRVSAPGYYKEYSTDWDAVNRRLRASDYFGGSLTNSGGFLSDISKEIKAKYTNPMDRLKAAYEAIKVVKWDGDESLYASTTALSTAFKKGQGNSADINMMLYKLLNDLDISALPVVMSTRENGELNLFSPSYNKLNYTLVCATVGDKKYVLDASEKYLPMGMLPERCLNARARVVNNGEGYWVDVKPEKGDKKMITYNLELTPELKFKGTMTQVLADYAAYDLRKEVAQAASMEKFITQKEAEYPGLLIKNYSFDKLDSIYSPINANYEIEVSSKAEKINDMIMINPFMFEQVKENLFKLEDRQYPVDFAYTREKTVSVKIKIPEGYTVAEMPKPFKVITPENTMVSLISVSVMNNEINVLYRLQIKKIAYEPSEYAYIKELYNQIIKKQSEPVILKPIANEARL